MSAHHPTDSDVSIGDWLGDETQAHPAAQATPPAAAPTTPVAAQAPEPMFAYTPVQNEDESDGVARQRERYGGLNWGAGFFGWLVVAGVAAVLSSVAAAGVAALGLTDEVLSADAAGGTGAVAIATAATLFGVLFVASYAGGYVAGRMSRFDGGRQGVAVWLTGLLLGGVGVVLGLLADARYGAFDQVRLPATPVATETANLVGVIGAVALASLLAAVVGGKVGCRYHSKVDDAAYV